MSSFSLQLTCLHLFSFPPTSPTPVTSPPLCGRLPSTHKRLCVCDMDRLGRNEFIGEVRVALKKLREGENKRYNMGLERIAQVCAGVGGEVGSGGGDRLQPQCIYFKWADVYRASWHVLFVCLPVGHHFQPLRYEVEQMSNPEAPLVHNHHGLSSLFQNKEANNQTAEQGAVVAEEEVKLTSALSAPISLPPHSLPINTSSPIAHNPSCILITVRQTGLPPAQTGRFLI